MKFINKLSSFVDLFLDWSSNPKKFLKIFQILFYYVPAVLTPVLAIIMIGRIFQIPFPFGIIHIGIILTLILASFFVFKVYWSRAKNLSESSQGNKFFIIPSLAHYIKTLGEVWFAVYAATPILFIFAQLDILFRDGGKEIIEMIGGDFFAGAAIAGVVIFPLIGYFVMVVTKFIAESISAIVEIANNTAK